MPVFMPQTVSCQISKPAKSRSEFLHGERLFPVLRSSGLADPKGADGMLRTDFRTFSAIRTDFRIDDREMPVHHNGLNRAVFDAYATGNAGSYAILPGQRAPFMI